MRLRARTDRHQAAKVRKARATLRNAINRAAYFRSEALWTNGYRTRVRDDSDEHARNEEKRLYQKEMKQFEACGEAEAAVERAITAFARAVRNSR